MGKIANALNKHAKELKARHLPKLTVTDRDVLLAYNRETGHLMNYESESGRMDRTSSEVLRKSGTIQRLLENKLIYPGGKLTPQGLQAVESIQESIKAFDPTNKLEKNSDKFDAAYPSESHEYENRAVLSHHNEFRFQKPKAGKDLSPEKDSDKNLNQSNYIHPEKLASKATAGEYFSKVTQDKDISPAPELIDRDSRSDLSPAKLKHPIKFKPNRGPETSDATSISEKAEPVLDRKKKFKAATENKSVINKGSHRIDKQNRDSMLIALSDSNSNGAEQFKILRTSILFPVSGKAPKTILVTSSMPGEGKTFVSANLAASIALNVNKHVLLIDCDLRKPDLHRLFGYSETPGLSNYLIENEDLSSLLLRTDVVSNLTLLPAGPTPSNPSELISTERMSDLIEEVKNRYPDRLVVIDSPPPALAAEGAFLARHVDSVIIVVKHGRTPRQEIEDLIQTVGAEKIIGIVVNQMDMKFSRYYGYSKYGKYGKRYHK